MINHLINDYMALRAKVVKVGSLALLCVVLLGFAALPAVALAGCPDTANKTSGVAGYLIVCKGTKDCPCTFSDLMLLGQRIILFFLFLSIPLITLAIVYTGFQYITAGSADVLKQAKERITKLLYGLFFLCTAYLIVYTILKTFVDPAAYPIIDQGSVEIRFPY